MSWARRGWSNFKLIRGGVDRAMERSSFRGLDEQFRMERQRSARRVRSWLTFVSMWAGAALFGTAYGAGWLAPPSNADAATADSGVRAHFSMCFTGGGYNCVVDGDTIWLKGVKIRIADIDAPETHDPRCASEKELGDRATLRLQQLLNNGVVTLDSIDRDRDRYGRELRIVDVNGRSAGSVLVAEGLAREWDGARHPWC